MRILAIDTSCGAASVAVVEGGRAAPLAVISRPMARGHADALPLMVEEAMRGVEGGFPSLARVAVAIGPGSFTGIRIGLAMARAMGMALAHSGGRRFDSGRLRRAAPKRAKNRNYRRGDRCSSRLGLFSVVRGVRTPAGAASLRYARECVRAIGAGPAWFAGDAAALVASEAQRAGLPYDLDAARAAPDIVALASDGPRRRPLEKPRAPPLREAAGRAAKCGRAHRQGAGLSALISP